MTRSQTHRTPYIAHVDIVGARQLSADAIASLVRTHSGDTLDEHVLEADIRRLLAAYADLGFTFAEIRPSGVGQADSDHISITLHVAEGPRARLVSCKVEGISETDTDVIRREFFTSQRPPLSSDLLEAGVLRLRQAGIFTSVYDPELFKVSDSTVGISLRVQEARSTSIDGVLGYAPAPIAGASGYLNGFLDLAFGNIGGSARAARLRYERLTPSTSDLSAGYVEPWLLGLPIDVSLGLVRHDQDSLFVSTHLELSGALHSISSVLIGATASYDGITPGRSGVVNSSNIFSGGLGLSMDERDDRIAPRHGYMISLGGSFGSKTTTDSLGFSSVASISALSASAEAAMHLLGTRLIGFLAVQAREVSSKALELSDLYRLGGLSTLRGYREATFFASRYVLARAEPRFMLSARSYLGMFLDVGALEQVHYGREPDRKWSALGYGVSILFDTQIGYVQAAVALSRGTPLDGAVLHLGLRTAF